MKFSSILLACSASASEIDDSPIAKLNYMTSITSNVLSAGQESVNKGERWTQRWTNRFNRNTERMKKHFARCGTTNVEAHDDFNEVYNSKNPCEAVNKLTNRISNWTDRYMSLCNGQNNKSHQKKRMTKWRNLLSKGKRLNLKSTRLS